MKKLEKVLGEPAINKTRLVLDIYLENAHADLKTAVVENLEQALGEFYEEKCTVKVVG